MNTSLRYWTQLGQMHGGQRVALFVAVVGVLVALLATVGYTLQGSLGLAVAAIAGIVCLVGGGASLAMTELLRGPNMLLPATLLGMFVRMGVPLVVLAIVVFQRGPLLHAGLPYYLCAIYPLALAWETALSVAPLQASRTTQEGS